MTDLSSKEQEALTVIEAASRKVAVITVRELAEALGYESVSMAHRFMASLEEKKRIRQIKRGVYEVVEQ